MIVEAKREQRKEEEGSYSYSCREVTRSYPIPKGVDKKNLTSAFSRNGILEIEAPMLQIEDKVPEKTSIAVTHVEENL